MTIEPGMMMTEQKKIRAWDDDRAEDGNRARSEQFSSMEQRLEIGFLELSIFDCCAL